MLSIGTPLAASSLCRLPLPPSGAMLAFNGPMLVVPYLSENWLAPRTVRTWISPLVAEPLRRVRTVIDLPPSAVAYTSVRGPGAENPGENVQRDDEASRVNPDATWGHSPASAVTIPDVWMAA